MKDWSLRLARVADAAAMPAIEAAAGKLFDNIEGLAALAGRRTIPEDRLLRYIAKGHCLVASDKGQIIGFLVNQPFGRDLHIWEFDVIPSHQQQEIEAGLLRACLIDARNTGFSSVTLTTFRDVPWNAPFYEGVGFQQVTDWDAHPRLAKELELEAAQGLPADQRCAMLCRLD